VFKLDQLMLKVYRRPLPLLTSLPRLRHCRCCCRNGCDDVTDGACACPPHVSCAQHRRRRFSCLFSFVSSTRCRPTVEYAQ